MTSFLFVTNLKKELSWIVSYHSEDGKFLQQCSTMLDSKEDTGEGYWLKGHGPIRIVSQVKVSIQAKLTLHYEKCSHSRFYAGHYTYMTDGKYVSYKKVLTSSNDFIN